MLQFSRNRIPDIDYLISRRINSKKETTRKTSDPIISAPLGAWKVGSVASLARPRALTIEPDSITHRFWPVPVTNDVFTHKSGYLYFLGTEQERPCYGKWISNSVASLAVAYRAWSTMLTVICSFSIALKLFYQFSCHCVARHSLPHATAIRISPSLHTGPTSIPGSLLVLARC